MTKLSPKTQLLLPLATALALSACAAPFEARVARFQQLPPPSGTSFVIEPRDKENAGGLEFATYANLVRQKLIAAGYQEAASADAASLTVQLDYNVSAPREKVQSRPGLGWGGWGPGLGWGPYWGRGWGWGGWGGGFGGGWGGWGGGWNNDVYSVTNYNTVVAMRINRNADKQSVFEGRAETVSNSNNLTRLVPNLVTAMFTNFPGSSGETVRVRFDPAKPDVAPTVKPVR
ncbi:DUF4136 domain-containing protein [Sandarakinorhabdus sp. AAP62]|uniref:DUF4136 domain-containing protein n=1 Tax=Sandarakinorhabdus sp. AAP62 TaxID=1248916 RepID=UPI0002E4E9BE|nr:DUF4136 domain-containing protein [Sandarakinorhabdus sp. AAP62]